MDENQLKEEKKQAAIAIFVDHLTTKLGVTDVNMDLLLNICGKQGGFGYATEGDASMVSGNDQSEIDRVINTLLIKQTGLDESPALQDMVTAGIEAYGKSYPKKLRIPLYYYILVSNNLVEAYMA